MADIDRYKNKLRRREKARLYTVNYRRRQVGLPSLQEPPSRFTTPDRTHAPTEMELAWAAGFLEGEAWFGYVKYGTGRKGYVRVAVSQINLEPLLLLQEMFGGSIWEQRWTKPRPSGKMREPMHWWGVNSTRAARVMDVVYKLMSQKRKSQIDTALEKWKDNWYGDPRPLQGEETA